jgi:hypothetical protein
VDSADSDRGRHCVGRAYIQELGRFPDGRSAQAIGICHDRYQRTPHGWKFTERFYETRYLDMTPLAGSPPQAEAAADPPTRARLPPIWGGIS